MRCNDLRWFICVKTHSFCWFLSENASVLNHACLQPGALDGLRRQLPQIRIHCPTKPAADKRSITVHLITNAPISTYFVCTSILYFRLNKSLSGQLFLLYDKSFFHTPQQSHNFPFQSSIFSCGEAAKVLFHNQDKAS